MAAAGRLLLGLAALASPCAAAPAETCSVGRPGCAGSATAEALAEDVGGHEPASLSLLQDRHKRGAGLNDLTTHAPRHGPSTWRTTSTRAPHVRHPSTHAPHATSTSKTWTWTSSTSQAPQVPNSTTPAPYASPPSGKAAGAAPACPPPNLKPVTKFNVSEWIRKSWFAIEQVPVPFQPNPLLCVTATYNLATPCQKLFKVPFFCGDIILVSNWQTNGAAELCGSVVKPNQPSAIKVAPCFLPVALAGDYWVIHVASNADGSYRWGLVSSGPPEEQAADGCVNPAGTWIFSRTPQMSKEDLAEAKKILKNFGYSLSALVPVLQAGCSYKGAPLK